MKREAEELSDELMRGEELCGEVEAMRFVAERRLSQAYAEWCAVKAGLPVSDQDAAKCDREMNIMRQAVRDFATTLKMLADVLHKRRSEIDPGGALDCDIQEFARKAAGP